MMMIVGSLVFVGAFAAAIYVMVATAAPQWNRMVRLARGQVEPAFSPLATLAVAERRIAVRRWAAAPVPAGLRRLRAAA